MRLRAGVEAPASGSIALNGPTIAEQIGAQIFMDAFAMMAPGDPDQAVYNVRQAASVSHDGLALEAACYLGAMEAMAFDRPELEQLLDAALRLYVTLACCTWWKTYAPSVRPIRSGTEYGRSSTSAMVMTSTRGPATLCPITGWCLPRCCWAAIISSAPSPSLRRRALIPTATPATSAVLTASVSAWGALTSGADFRSPVADRMYVVTADGGSCVTDAVQQTRRILAAASAYRNESIGLCPARFGFDFRGSTQGFTLLQGARGSSCLALSNLNQTSNENGLLVEYRGLAPGISDSISTSVFLDFAELAQNFATIASPTLYPTQTVVAHLRGMRPRNPTLRFFALYYDSHDQVTALQR